MPFELIALLISYFFSVYRCHFYHVHNDNSGICFCALIFWDCLPAYAHSLFFAFAIISFNRFCSSRKASLNFCINHFLLYWFYLLVLFIGFICSLSFNLLFSIRKFIAYSIAIFIKLKLWLNLIVLKFKDTFLHPVISSFASQFLM